MITQDNAWPVGMREKVACLEAANAEKDAEIARLRTGCNQIADAANAIKAESARVRL